MIRQRGAGPMLMPPNVQFAPANPRGPFGVKTQKVTVAPGATQGMPQSIVTVFVTWPFEGTAGTGQGGAITEAGATKTEPPVPVKVT